MALISGFVVSSSTLEDSLMWTNLSSAASAPLSWATSLASQPTLVQTVCHPHRLGSSWATARYQATARSSTPSSPWSTTVMHSIFIIIIHMLYLRINNYKHIGLLWVDYILFQLGCMLNQIWENPKCAVGLSKPIGSYRALSGSYFWADYNSNFHYG